MVLLKERVSKLIDYIQDTIYSDPIQITNFKTLKSQERFKDISSLDTSDWKNIDNNYIWGGHREYYWFETFVTIPKEYEGCCTIFKITTGKEGEWDATNPQFSCYVNDKLIQGLDVNHREVILTENAESGKIYRILLSAFSGDSNFSLKLDCKILKLNKKIEKYFYDIKVPLQVAKLLPEDSIEYIEIIKSINDSLNLVDLRDEKSENYFNSIELADKNFNEVFYERLCRDKEPKIYCVGHTHIDVAWLWTLRVTEDKAVRSFSTVIELMDRYPEYIFMSSQPQLYKFVKKNNPQLYGKIKERINEGRWEVEGGMWVEADCNLASGESLVRQFIHGKKFFKDEFDKDNKILWLPDVFGYSAALPQIIKKCGLSYFMTTKISWNEFDKMPYDSFEWEGIDGTRVLTHFISTQEFKVHIPEGDFRTEHTTTYNGELNPNQMIGSWNRYSQKYLNKETLCSFGYGDGGGGATKEMLESQRRMAKGIPGCPQTKMSTSLEFFKQLENQVQDNKYLPTWIGELYLEYHRGTYTSMARNKKYNRKSEFLALNAESSSVMTKLLLNKKYKSEELYDIWETILKNQFHDILPGSSIKEVYEDSLLEYEGIFDKTKSIIEDNHRSVVDNIEAEKDSLIVFNSNGMDLSDVVEIQADNFEDYCIYDGNLELKKQKINSNTYIFKSTNIPSKGYKTFTTKKSRGSIESSLRISKKHMENEFFDIKFNDSAQFISIYDKCNNREILKKGTKANVLMTYEDRPHNFDAWDINNYFDEKSWEIDNVVSWEVIEEGPVRAAMKISRKYLKSTITQYIYLYDGLKRIDIKNEIDWKEHQILLKDYFDIDLNTDEATYDIQYGNVVRKTNKNTSWDFARFETCSHKWLDVSENNYGVSFLNDCKYGSSVYKGKVGLTMLKSGVYPNPEADQEMHEFTYSLLPHDRSWRESNVVQESYKLNNPLVGYIKHSNKGNLSNEYSLVKSSLPNVIIESVQESLTKDSTIVRFYECYNRRSNVVLTFSQNIKSIEECDMLENKIESSYEFDSNNVNLIINPFEIKTFKIVF